MDAVPSWLGSIALPLAGAGFALAGLWLLLRGGRGTAHAAAALAVFLTGAALMALPWLPSAETALPPAGPPAPVTALPGTITVSPDGLRTVAAPKAEPPPPLPGRPATRIAIEATEAEPNDNLVVANRAALGTAIDGSLGAGDLDYFAVDVPGTARGEIVVNLLAVEGDADLTLFDDAGQALGNVRTRSGNSIRAVTLVRKLDRPRYHVLVLAAPTGRAAYQLTIAERRR